MDEKDFWRSGKLLIDQYGADAAIHAAMRADQVMEAADVQGVYVWTRVLKAIEELTTGRGRGIRGAPAGLFTRRLDFACHKLVKQSTL